MLLTLSRDPQLRVKMRARYKQFYPIQKLVVCVQSKLSVLFFLFLEEKLQLELT